MQYILLLRGINIGGKNKVKMAELKEQLMDLGYERTASYINSGNILFYSNKKRESLIVELRSLFSTHYDFPIPFTLLSAEDYKRMSSQLPAWWEESLARKDVLFFTESSDKEKIIKNIEGMELYEEILHREDRAIFWGKYDEKEYLKTAYHKHLIKQSYYKEITIRNGKTFQKILSMIVDRESTDNNEDA